jgi:hypothetical protein
MGGGEGVTLWKERGGAVGFQRVSCLVVHKRIVAEDCRGGVVHFEAVVGVRHSRGGDGGGAAHTRIRV